MASNCRRLTSRFISPQLSLIRRSSSPTLPPGRWTNLNLCRHYLPTRYDPFEEMRKTVDRLFREFDRTFASPFSFFPARVTATSLPIESYDTERGLLRIEIDMAGFKPEDIQVTAKNRQVEIVGKREAGGEMREYREFRYRYSFPEKAEIDKVRSLLKPDGLLIIEAPLPRPEMDKIVGDQEIPIKKE